MQSFNQQLGNVSVEYVIVLAAFFIIGGVAGVMLGDSGMVGNGSLITAFRDAYQSFFENYSNALMNLDVIPNENP